MIYDDLDKETFDVELEKGIVKQKYDSLFSNKDDCSMSGNSSAETTKVPGIRTSVKVREMDSSNSNIYKNNSEISDLEKKSCDLWEEMSGSMVYNLKNKKLNLGNLKATNYKYNKYVNTPDPETTDIETKHQFRRTEARRIFDRAVAKYDPNPSRVVADNGRGSLIKSKRTNPESNLSSDELLGLKSLKKRIKDGSIVIA